ncbi:MAG TPA: hypothetical protein VKT25_02075 [Ktedonobacteraceae bacterium]|nr:hypothetical protein [Ktedonobacteraceae bacterium]
MCISCGCGEPNDDHGDSRNITLDDLNQAAAAAGTTRDRVLQNMMGGVSGESDTKDANGANGASAPPSQTTNAPKTSQTQPANNGQEANSFLPANQPRPQPGKPSEQLGQESGSDWQESQQMGRTGLGGVQKSQED